jgi:hypothetical protein
MQQVLNSQERNQAFLKFLLFFLVTVVLIITAVFFNFRLPVRENKMLQSEVDIQRTQDVSQQKFVGLMQDAVRLLDSLDKPGTNVEQINLQLNSKIHDLAGIEQNENTIYGKMDKIIIDKFVELQQAKKNLQDSKSNLSKQANVQSDLDKCQAQNIELQASLDRYRKATPAGF